MAHYDLIVIGGGPAGYAGAIRGAQEGKKVACIEADNLGGTCLNWGCIPTKSLLRNAEIYQLISKRAKEFGLKVEGLSYDWDTVITRSRRVSTRLCKGVEFLLKKNKIDHLRGIGALTGDNSVEVTGADGEKQTHTASSIIIATGCVSRPLPDLPFDGKQVISSKEALVLPEQPEEIVIIGAGAIGVEFAYFFNAFGTKVTLVEMLDHLLPIEDTEVSQTLERSFKKQGITVLTGHKMLDARTSDQGVELDIAPVDGGDTKSLTAPLCLVAIGVQPLLPQGAEQLTLDRGYIQVNERYETSLPGVFAAGDIIGPPWLAHVATFEAVQCVEGLYKEGHTPRKADIFPGCTYCHPQIASVGLTERAATEQGMTFKVGKFPFLSSGKALAIGENEGFVKILYDEKTGKLLGAHIIGDNATELIGELGLALSAGLGWEEIEATIHAHPTLSEGIHEATGAVTGNAIHQ